MAAVLLQICKVERLFVDLQENALRLVTLVPEKDCHRVIDEPDLIVLTRNLLKERLATGGRNAD
jgi:hypothetical protein